jgi:hypothetical protein
MGWDFGSVDTGNIPEQKVVKLIGEGLSLSCVGTILYLVFLSAEAPWWTVLVSSQRARPVGVPPATGSTETGQLVKRQRRTGTVSLVRKSSQC